jgi:uncharacterized surface protein with fasciclin (FAS1) repeats
VNKKLIILLILAILIIAGSIFAYWFFVINTSDNSQPNEVQNTESQVDKPASTKNIAELIDDNTKLSTFTDVLKTSGVAETLKGEGPYTVFAPSNEAFNALPSGTLDRLLKPVYSSQLTSITKYHATVGSLLASQLTNGQKIKTINDQELVMSLDGTNVYVIDAKGDKALITKSDIKAKNGVIHIVNTVLLPQ